MRNSASNYYAILSIIFMVLSIIAGMALFRTAQDLREQATYPSACTSVGQACENTYNEACTLPNGGSGTHSCHKIGTCQGVGDNTQCSWGTGSSCTTCTANSIIPNPTASAWMCQVCDCSNGGWNNGQCTNCGGLVPCSSVSALSCGQIDACPPGQPTTQCGAASENRVVYTNGCTTSTNPTSPPSQQTGSSPTPTRIPPTSTPTRIPPTSTPTRIPTSTATPTRNPTNTPVPTSTRTPSPTATPRPDDTPVPTATPTNIPAPTDTPVPNPTATPVVYSTPQPTATTEPLAQGPSPTRILLPNAGVSFPIQGLTVVGTIISLLGLLVLL